LTNFTKKMATTIFLLHLLIWALLKLVVAQVKPVYIRISESSAVPCTTYAGFQNRRYLDLTSDNINFADPNQPGVKVEYIKLPGEYSLEFHDVEVRSKSLQYLVGDLNIKLRANLYGTEVELDVVPAVSSAGYNCSTGKVIQHQNGQLACRFCDLCSQATQIESDLTRQKWVAAGGRSAGECSEFYVGRKYNFAKRITLPSPEIAKSQIENTFEISEKLNEAFATGKGRVSAQMALFSKPRSVNKDSYCNQECGPGQLPSRCWWCKQEFGTKLQQGLLTGAGAGENCMSDADNTELAACYHIEFRYDASEDSPNNQLTVANIRSNSVDPCANEMQQRRSWCRSCWWCSGDFCSLQCRCNGDLSNCKARN